MYLIIILITSHGFPLDEQLDVESLLPFSPREGGGGLVAPRGFPFRRLTRMQILLLVYGVALHALVIVQAVRSVGTGVKVAPPTV